MGLWRRDLHERKLWVDECTSLFNAGELREAEALRVTFMRVRGGGERKTRQCVVHTQESRGK